MIKIIKAEEKYIPEVFEIEKAAFSPSWMEGSLLRQLDDEDAYFVIALEDETVLGFCILHKMTDEGEIYQIAVDEASRRRGVGDLLMRDTMLHARESGVMSLFLEVRKGNIPAIDLYKKHGFIVVGHRKKYYSYPTEDAVVMSFTDKPSSEKAK